MSNKMQILEQRGQGRINEDRVASTCFMSPSTILVKGVMATLPSVPLCWGGMAENLYIYREFSRLISLSNVKFRLDK